MTLNGMSSDPNNTVKEFGSEFKVQMTKFYISVSSLQL